LRSYSRNRFVLVIPYFVCSTIGYHSNSGASYSALGYMYNYTILTFNSEIRPWNAEEYACSGICLRHVLMGFVNNNCIHVYSPEIREVCDSKRDAIFKDLTIVRKKLFLKDLILLVRSH